ncbi:Hypothetical protein BHY_1136 (plasmid) [Borrelia nietonii YOR]|uniref:Uncharacterized protein n=1 Tax=Borrelia nietonii YOR TaxID=1293576 RepID=W5SAV2_9SPIR|nr:Hypothetical protein BHY_1136 [Borrelia nietonii YOR]
MMYLYHWYINRLILKRRYLVVKKRHYNLLLLLLLLLVIGCNLKSKEDKMLKDGFSSGSLFENSMFKGKSRYDPYTKLVVGRSVDEDSSKGLKNGMGGVFGVGAEGSAGVKFNRLLRIFKIPREEGEIIEYMRLAVTNTGIGSAEGYRTYTDSEFYTLLGNLGKAKLQEIIKAHLENVQGLREALRVIDALKAEESKQQLQGILKVEENSYLKELKRVFNESIPDKVYHQAISVDYAGQFNKIKDDVIKIRKEELYASLSGEERLVIEHMRDVATNSSVGLPAYKTYTELEFDLLLIDLGDVSLKKIIGDCSKVSTAKEGALRAINAVAGEKSKQDLERSYDYFNNSYPSYLKGMFSGSTLDDVRRRIINIDYAGHFAKIESDARNIARTEALYAGLSVDEIRTLEHIQGVVTDSGRISAGSRTYTDSEFYNLLESFDTAKLKKFIEVPLKIFEEIDEVFTVIDAIREEKLRQNLKGRLEDEEILCARGLRAAFNGFNPDDVYGRVTSIDYADNLLGLKNYARRIVEVEELYAGLSVDEKKTARYIQKAVTDPGIGDLNEKTYTELEFKRLLINLGALGLQEIINVHVDTFRILREVEVAINDVKDADLKQELSDKFEAEEGTYAGLLKKAFNSSTLDSVQSQAVGINYLDNFISIKNEAEQKSNP